MDILATIWTVTVGVLLVLLGFNALIVVHEWGHFIVARLCGVRCEKFYIWFDFWGLRFFKFKWGNTEYGLGLFPLGGYLKMLGQEDNPGAIQAEIERAKLQAAQSSTGSLDGTDSLDSAAVETEDFPPKPNQQSLDNGKTTSVYNGNEYPLPPKSGEQNPSADAPRKVDDAAETPPCIFAPDSYLSKSVPQRLAIIVAGVVMNFLFAIVCAAGAYMVGVKELVPIVGNTVPGSPAWEAGLQTGDRIVTINGKPSKDFRDVSRKLIAGTKNVKLSIEREGQPVDIEVAVRKRSAGELMPLIGITSQPSLELASSKIPSLWEKYYAPETLAVFSKKTPPLRLEKVDGQVVSTYAEYQDAQLEKIGQPITCTFSGAEVEIPAIPMRAIPVRFAMGEIVSVLPGSDAEKQGIQPGDTLVSVDGDAEVDPLKLPQILLQKVNVEQKAVELVVRKADGNEQTLTLALAPTRFVPELSGASIQSPLGSTAMGLSWRVEPMIAAVDESALLAGQDVPAIGDRVTDVEFVNCEPPLRKNSFSAPTKEGGFHFRDIGSAIDLPYIFGYALQATLPKEPKKGEVQKPLSVRLTLESADRAIKIVPLPIVEATDWFYLERGFVLQADESFFLANGWGDALMRGMVKTADDSLLIYRSLNSIVNGTVSPRGLMGPIGIIDVMYKVAQSGWGAYLMLLCLVGANLAVINLLPIPPLDGGHVVFLTYEGIFGRPPNELIQIILSYAGLLLIVLLMLWTITLDLSWISRW